jgi:hypothetical protein
MNSTKAAQRITVGNVVVPLEKARQWVRDYTDPMNAVATRPYAYPAYDMYEHCRNDPTTLSDADLLAPGLLNVPLKIRSYYGLQRIRSLLESGLANSDLEIPLAEADDTGRIAATVRPLYEVLDDPSLKPWNVNATTRSKILHRKRPQSLVLHDRWVNACYVSADGPVHLARKRSWADYMTAITVAIGNDIRNQRSAFDELAEATSAPGSLSHVRLLDIIAWTSRGATGTANQGY